MRTAKKRSPALILGIVAAVIGGGIGLWEWVLEERFVPKRFGVVEEAHLYRSGQISRFLIEDTLAKHEIDVVIDLTGFDENDPDQVTETSAIETLGIDGRRFPMRGDGTGKLENVINAVTAIHESQTRGDKVLVHCAAGTQRTGHVLSAYLLLVRDRAGSEVWREMTRYDWDPDKDKEWPRMLNENMPEIANALVERGVIAEVPSPLPVFAPAGDASSRSESRSGERP